MRLKLILQTTPNSVLAYSYHFALRAVIYKVLKNADPVFSAWLHDKGYEVSGSKAFKLFTFDELRGKPFRYNNEQKRLTFTSGIVEWTVSFCVDQQMEKFVEGLFKNQTLEVVADGTKVVFEVKGVEIEKPPQFTETMRFRIRTGICLTEKEETQRNAQFRYPSDANFKDLFFRNLIAKTQAMLQNKNTTTPPDILGRGQHLNLKILTKYRKWSVVEPDDNSPKPIRTIGSAFNFEITAPVEWLEISFAAGFGGKCSSGFGFCEVL